jgi:hypothetical protein
MSEHTTQIPRISSLSSPVLGERSIVYGEAAAQEVSGGAQAAGHEQRTIQRFHSVLVPREIFEVEHERAQLRAVCLQKSRATSRLWAILLSMQSSLTPGNVSANSHASSSPRSVQAKRYLSRNNSHGREMVYGAGDRFCSAR